MTTSLWIVMPAYNEEASVASVFEEWLPVLGRIVDSFTFCALNDGSRDGTLALLREVEATTEMVQVIDKPNSGHGNTCLMGYRRALEAGAEWVLQIDSDGQCDPCFFPAFWAERHEHPVVYGFRRARGDGRSRALISRAVSFTTWLGTGIWVRDANVPYRLMHRDKLSGLVDRIPEDFHLVNVYLAAMQQERHGIHWIEIGHRVRSGGTPSVKTFSFPKQGWRLLQQLRAAQRRG